MFCVLASFDPCNPSSIVHLFASNQCAGVSHSRQCSQGYVFCQFKVKRKFPSIHLYRPLYNRKGKVEKRERVNECPSTHNTAPDLNPHASDSAFLCLLMVNKGKKIILYNFVRSPLSRLPFLETTLLHRNYSSSKNPASSKSSCASASSS